MIIDLRTYLIMLRRSLRQEEGGVPFHLYLFSLKRREKHMYDDGDDDKRVDDGVLSWIWRKWISIWVE